MNSQQKLFAEVDQLIRTRPNEPSFAKVPLSTLEWLGRAVNAVARFDPTLGEHCDNLSKTLAQARTSSSASSIIKRDRTELLRVLTVVKAVLAYDAGIGTVIIDAGQTFEYFEHIRHIVSKAATDVLFVDPYATADLVTTYLPVVPTTVPVRILTLHKTPEVVAAATKYRQQHGSSIAVHRAAALHDRFLFVDGAKCYHSGASFKDGALKSPVIVSTVEDAFAAVHTFYEAEWTKATKEL